MKGSLRTMHCGFIITVIVAVLIIGNTQDASAQTNTVECPCDFESVPMTTGCWTEQFPPEFPQFHRNRRGEDGVCFTESFREEGRGAQLSLLVGAGGTGACGEGNCCKIIVDSIESSCTVGAGILKEDITPEQVLACQCELLAYTTALNEVAGISVSPDPPYACGNVDLRTCQGLPAPIPTLNEYGMIITAGVLGLLAVIGLFVMRRKKATA